MSTTFIPEDLMLSNSREDHGTLFFKPWNSLSSFDVYKKHMAFLALIKIRPAQHTYCWSTYSVYREVKLVKCKTNIWKRLLQFAVTVYLLKSITYIFHSMYNFEKQFLCLEPRSQKASLKKIRQLRSEESGPCTCQVCFTKPDFHQQHKFLTTL